ncbi:MAG: 3-keto-5-aminohexanoate cleavage protein [Desulfobacteraceae bacterium]
MEKLIITVALTGNVPTKEMNPNLPVDPDEIAQDVRRCADAGACLFHIHARDSQQKPTLDINIFKAIVQKVKQIAPEVIIQLSTGARAGKDWQDRANPVMLLPEMGSFTTGSNNLAGIVYENAPKFIEYLAKVYQDNKVKPEIEVFETGMINNALFLQKKGLLEAPLHFDFVLGAAGSMPATPKNVLFLSESIPQGSTWSVAGIGKAQIPMAACAILMGGHARIGLEDNIYMPDGTPASNVGLAEKVAAMAREIGRDIADPDEARAILSIEPEAKDRILETIN